MTDEKKKTEKPTGPRIEVVDCITRQVVHVVKLSSKSPNHAAKVDAGMQRNLNHEQFYTRTRGCRNAR